MKPLWAGLFLVSALLAILVPYVLVSFFTGIENAVYCVIVLATYMLLIQFYSSSSILVWLGGALALSLPISTFVYSGNGHFVLYNGLPHLIGVQELIMSTVRFIYFALFLRIIRHQIVRLREQRQRVL